MQKAAQYMEETKKRRRGIGMKQGKGSERIRGTEITKSRKERK